MRPTSPPCLAPPPRAIDSEPAHVLAVGLDAVGVERLGAALQLGTAPEQRIPVHAVSDWSLAARPGSGSPAAAVFDPFLCADPAPLLAAFPGVRLIAYASLCCDSEALLRVLRSGVHGFVTRDVDDTPVGFAYQLRRAGAFRAASPSR